MWRSKSAERWSLRTETGEKRHHFVLVHGAWHGAWCWVKVIAALEKAGHRATAIDLVSAGESQVRADDVTSLKQYNKPLEKLFESFPDDERVVLVGHSVGGLCITRIAELYSEKVCVAIFLAAYMPPPGLDIFHLLINDPDFIHPYEWTYYCSVAGGPPTSQGVTTEDLKNYYYNKCSPEDVAFALDHQKVAPYLKNLLAPIEGSMKNYDTVPRVYVIGQHDKATSLRSAHKFIALNPPNQVIEIDSDNSMFFSALEAVEKILIEAAEEYDF